MRSPGFRFSPQLLSTASYQGFDRKHERLEGSGKAGKNEYDCKTGKEES